MVSNQPGVLRGVRSGKRFSRRAPDVTASLDSFTVRDTHWISGSFADAIIVPTSSLNINDAAWDSATYSAQGTRSGSVDYFRFNSVEA